MALYPTNRAIVKDTMAAVYVDVSQSASEKRSLPKILIFHTPDNEAVTRVKAVPVINITITEDLNRETFSLSIIKLTNTSKIEIVEVMVAKISNK